MKKIVETQDNDFETRVYEVSYLIVPSVVQEKLQDKVEVLRGVITSAKGSIIAEGEPKFRELAYDMTATVANKKTTYHDGYFGWIKFEADTQATKDIHTALEANNDLIRFMLIKTVREDACAIVSEILAKETEDKFRKERGKDAPLKVVKEVPAAAAPEASKEEIDETIDKLLVD